MGNKDWIELAFIMRADGSVRRVRFLPLNHTGSSASFTIKSTGEVRQGAFPFIFPSVVRRRLQAEYRLNDDDASVGNLQEVGNLITDTALLLTPAVPAADERPGYQELSQFSP